MNIMVIYHAPCHDGFAAAWAVHDKFKDTLIYDSMEFYPARYGDNPPDVKNKTVYMLDFCYQREIMEKLADQCMSMEVLDHHKSAMEMMKGFEHPKVKLYFDLTRSGAGLSWDFWNKGKSRPWIIDYTEDRDLWKNKLPSTNEINAYLFSLPYDFEIWDRTSKRTTYEIKTLGIAILEHQKRLQERVLGNDSENVCIRTVMGYEVPIINTTVMQSEIGNKLAQSYPFSVMYLITRENEVLVSFRSTDSGVDVSDIAKHYGGGGHRNASGCRWSLSTLMEILND